MRIPLFGKNPGASDYARPTKWADPRDAAIACGPTEAAARASPLIADIEPLQLTLRGNTGPNPNFWEEFTFNGPGILKARPIGGVDQLSNAAYDLQYLGFLYAPGNRPPNNNDLALHSRGCGEARIPHGGKWWLRPVRSDIVPLNLVFFPLLCPESPSDQLPMQGAANLHSHYGIRLAAMANDGVDATLPAAATAFLLYSYNLRASVTIEVPFYVYQNDGSANWTNVGDTVVDQSAGGATGALIGVSTYQLAGNYTRFNQWDTSPPTLQGRGLITMKAGDRRVFAGDSKFPGPILIVNLRRTGVSYVTVEEYT